jgi:hypothetical protein
MCEIAKRVRTPEFRLALRATARVRRCLALEALITEMDGEQIRDSIMGNPRSAL